MSLLKNKIAQTRSTESQQEQNLPPHLRNPETNIQRPCLAVSSVKLDLMSASLKDILENSKLVCRNVVDHELYSGEYIQIIPYVTISTEQGKRILSYQRGSASQSDLVGEFSIGFGGHVDRLVWLPVRGGVESQENMYQNALLILLDEIGRELKEEINLDLTAKNKNQILSTLKEGIGSKLQVLMPAMTNKPSDARHLGLSLFLDLDDEQEAQLQNTILEEHHIIDLEVHNLADLNLPDVKKEFELWSRLVLTINYARVFGLKMYSPENVTDAYLREKAIFEGELKDDRQLNHSV